jgi:hypothetical protein
MYMLRIFRFFSLCQFAIMNNTLHFHFFILYMYFVKAVKFF